MAIKNKAKPQNKQAVSQRVLSDLNAVKAGFVNQGTSLNAWCINNDINQGNATRAVLGVWAGKKGKALRRRIIEASKLKKTVKIKQLEK
ncbi:hypothetical protein [Methylovulum psychrotolerans]|uniref:Uncharacterized protein n=1 Tax=Methylovulum psychrotolerans TaxID=1704499 RepID=A0A2S5CGD3_9GAMM|nr:hypothetical protein [Methylovulum psychrotolerans]POZ49868.1 hypothetical protein AADEFJLK_04314 [Methylovulum psychrotolerans]